MVKSSKVTCNYEDEVFKYDARIKEISEIAYHAKSLISLNKWFYLVKICMVTNMIFIYKSTRQKFIKKILNDDLRNIEFVDNIKFNDFIE